MNRDWNTSSIANRQGERLDFSFHAGRQENSDLVVLSHGVTSSKDRPWLVELSLALAQLGIASLRFSFSGNGASAGRFEAATLTKEVGDLGSVLEALAPARVVYVGHSMGAAVGVLCAARDERIRGLVSLAGMVHVERFFRTHFGTLAFGAPMLGKPACPWNRALQEDARRIGSVLEAARSVRVPWLLVHGTADELVPLEDALDAQRAAHEFASLQRLEGVDHRFSGAIEPMVAAVVPWIQAQF